MVTILPGKRIIGRKDKADFPDFGLEEITVKVDSGAYTSSIHCQEFAVINENGKKVLKFRLLDDEHPQASQEEYSYEKFKTKKVKSSNGHSQKRYIIQTRIILFGKERPIELSLANREAMRVPILLGRRFIQRYYLIDPSRTNLSFRKKQKSKLENNSNS